MNEQDEISRLREELQKLGSELQLQATRFRELKQRLDKLTGIPLTEAGEPARPPVRAPFSLENFIGLRLIQFIGIIVLVIGLSIGVKYAIDRNLISETLRIGLAYAAGLLLYLLSLQLRKKYTLFSALLFSGGMASLYFTTYGAYVYYNMFSFAVAFLLMILFTVYAVYEAIRYNREEIALLGLVGAYGIPFLISKNADRADLFFLYISLINSAVVFLSIRKLWRTVGRVALVITWVLFIGWASLRYNAALQNIGLGFLVFFFLLFCFQTLSPQIVQRRPLQIADTYQWILNNLALFLASLYVFGFSIEAASVPSLTLALSALTALQALLLHRFLPEEAYTVRMTATLSLTLFVLFIGSNWNGFTVTLLWLLTAVVVFIWGFRARSVSARMAAIVLIGVTLFKLVALDSLTFTTVQKVIAYLILGILLLVVSFFYQKFRQQLFDKD